MNPLNELWQETGDNQDDDANHQGHDGLLRTAFPFLQDDAPNIGEHHVECHQDAEGERHKGREFGEEALAQRQSEELAIPQGTSQSTEHKVVTPNFLLLVVAPSMVLAVLIETVDGIGDETTESYEEGGRQCLVHIGCQCAEVDVGSEGKAYVEATAHEASQEGDGKSLRKVEVLDCCLLFFFGE